MLLGVKLGKSLDEIRDLSVNELHLWGAYVVLEKD
jgi:hypothetical protein